MRSRTALLFAFTTLLGLSACKKVDPVEQRKLLASPDPKVRASAAEEIQKLYKKDPKSVGDVGIEEWEGRVKALPDASEEERKKLLATPVTPKSISEYRLDDFWTFPVKRDDNQRIIGAGPPTHKIAAVEVPPPDGYTGTWTTYYAHGLPHETDDYVSGKLTHKREMFELGTLKRDATMVEGAKPGTAVMNGLVITHYQDGKPEIEETYDKGVLNGPRKLYYPSGKVKQEGIYSKGELDGWLKNLREDGTEEWCILYDKGREVNRGCPLKK